MKTGPLSSEAIRVDLPRHLTTAMHWRSKSETSDVAECFTTITTSKDGWAGGTSQHFSGKPHLIELARQALDLVSPQARSCWLGRLESVNENSVESLISEVPSAMMSEDARTLALQLLARTRRRLLDGDQCS